MSVYLSIVMFAVIESARISNVSRLVDGMAV